MWCVWCCSVQDLCVWSQPTSVPCLLPLTSCFSPSFLPSFFPLSFSSPFAAVSCDLDEPASWFAHMEEAGFQKVPEEDSTTASRVSCLWELHWDKLDLSAVLFWSQPDGGLTSILTWHGFWSQQLIFEKTLFMYFVFHFYFIWLFYFFILFFPQVCNGTNWF